MKNWYIKTFRKRIAVRIFILTQDNRMRSYWGIPKGDQVDIRGVGIYKITIEEAVLTDRNVPTYIFYEQNVAPVDVKTGKQSEITPIELQEAVDAHVARDIIKASQGTGFSQDTIIIIGVMVVGFAGLAYFFNDKLTAIIEALNALGIG